MWIAQRGPSLLPPHREELRVDHRPHHNLLHQPLGRVLPGDVLPHDLAAGAVEDLVHHLWGAGWERCRVWTSRVGVDDEVSSRFHTSTRPHLFNDLLVLLEDLFGELAVGP